jgi:hypothetical protein
MNADFFEKCQNASILLEQGSDAEARNLIIQLLAKLKSERTSSPSILNHLVRRAGLYPYLQPETASWSDRFVFEVFKVNTGADEVKTLHREQSSLLKDLLAGNDLAVSAPTSFGKSFIIDAFIAIKKPNKAMIIVPTIALMDETRRRLQRKFGSEYKIITSTDASISPKSLLVFPQERAIGYTEKLDALDLLVVDEFYKASSDFDKERSPALLRAILELSKIAKQRYFLAPNIGSLSENPFTEGMRFVDKSNFSTVYLNQHPLYRSIGKDAQKKASALLRILKGPCSKFLIYAATYSEIDKVCALLLESTPVVPQQILRDFSAWLRSEYGSNWKLPELVTIGVGIHNGQIHRSLSQLQLRLFEIDEGLKTMVSTSSIIEGVNTAAEAVVLWKNSKGGSGNPKLDTFTYKNIIGRSGRMFKHFIGQVYLLDAPPEESVVELEIEFPDSMLGGIDAEEHKGSLSKEQISKIASFKSTMRTLIGNDAYTKLFGGQSMLQTSDFDFILELTRGMVTNPHEWNGFGFLNSHDTSKWDRFLYLIINLRPGGWDVRYSDFVQFIKILSQNWNQTIPQMLAALRHIPIDVNLFFKLERNVSFKFATLLHDVNEIQKVIFNDGVDVSPFVSKMSHAFLPSSVYQLEEYGLPRMISRKIHKSGMFNFEIKTTEIQEVITAISRFDAPTITSRAKLTSFERYILEYFLDGVRSDPKTMVRLG